MWGQVFWQRGTACAEMWRALGSESSWVTTPHFWGGEEEGLSLRNEEENQPLVGLSWPFIQAFGCLDGQRGSVYFPIPGFPEGGPGFIQSSMKKSPSG